MCNAGLLHNFLKETILVKWSILIIQVYTSMKITILNKYTEISGICIKIVIIYDSNFNSLEHKMKKFRQ
jgi:hypothetical protein